MLNQSASTCTVTIVVMSALPPEQMHAMRDLASGRDASALCRQWQAIHASAAEVAALADLSPEKLEGELAEFPDRIDAAQGWRRQLAQQGIEDIEAILATGLSALKAIAARGQDACAPAGALWREFHHARQGVLALAKVD